MKRLKAILNDFVTVIEQGLNKLAIELEEHNKNYPKSQYWKGYVQGVRDGKEMNHEKVSK